MYNNEQKNDENFWISYADLMAGLLFVFILVLGAIVIKYIYTQSNLEKEKLALNQSQEELINKTEVLNKLNSLIKNLENEKTELSNQLSKKCVRIKSVMPRTYASSAHCAPPPRISKLIQVSIHYAKLKVKSI